MGRDATIVTYGGEAQEAIDIVAKGGGGLVASLYTNDVGFGGEVVLPDHCAVQPGQRVKLGLRPEHLQMQAGAALATACGVTGISDGGIAWLAG